MGVLKDLDTLGMVFQLMDKGFTGEQIDRAMLQIIGNDWREVSVSVWQERLRNQEFILQNDEELSVGDLEALISGRIKLDEFRRQMF